MPYPKGSYVILTLDPEVLGPEKLDDGSLAVVECFSNLQIKVECEFTDPTHLKISRIFMEDITASSRISLMVSNFEINIQDPTITDTWTLTVFTADGFFIETIDHGLTLEFQCSIPCLTCRKGKPTSCTSCNNLAGLNILYQN